MRDTPPTITPAVHSPDKGYPNPPRSWQVIMTGNLTDPASFELVADLGRLLDLRPDLSHLTLDTDDGGIHVARDWPSDRMEEADELLARIEAAPGVRAVTLHGR